ncbi:MAG: hypothetical protein DRG59_09780 [Deltaproteobacteria bacterium]|nr:MAG: hypothetical protein DRG59_09780 [Deltaproteobacteria bacterium]
MVYLVYLVFFVYLVYFVFLVCLVPVEWLVLSQIQRDESVRVVRTRERLKARNVRKDRLRKFIALQPDLEFS